MVARCETRLPVRIYVVDLGEDDPKKCTARKMVEYGYACIVRRPPRGSVILDPYAETPLSQQDRGALAAKGLTVVDASWNRLDEKRFERISSRWRGLRRRLPILFAANPPHYGLAFKLSSIEAAAAALYIAGFRQEALELLRLYKWGPVFIQLNSELLDDYAEALNPREVYEKEAKLLSKILEQPVTPSSIPRLIRALSK